ncbi:MAG: MmcQ/YjbR family DNA-binding protein [Anaerolineae bacterium]|nr:MmcQ/YjbR family DNA-binding protein [Anaerolineae bacterium]
MEFEEIRQIALSFPGVEEHVVFGGPTFKVGKRFLASIAKIDPNTLVLKVPDRLEREYLLATFPDIYYLTDHYANFECVLVRMPQADPVELRNLFEQAWRTYAPKRLVAGYRADE